MAELKAKQEEKVGKTVNTLDDARDIKNAVTARR
jgi:hypothetical protein